MMNGPKLYNKKHVLLFAVMTLSREIFLKGYLSPLKDIENVCIFYAKYPKWIILNNEMP